MKLIYALLALLAGCASAPEYWVRTWEGAVHEPQVVLVGHVPASHAHAHGWTVCNRAARACTIYIRADADRACVEAHERRHAAGWEHPAYSVSLICTSFVDSFAVR
jgi:hypothetical protein